MDAEKKFAAKFMAALINSEEIQNLLEEEGVDYPMFVTSAEVLNVLNGKKKGISSVEIIAALKVFCKVTGTVCPYVEKLPG